MDFGQVIGLCHQQNSLAVVTNSKFTHWRHCYLKYILMSKRKALNLSEKYSILKELEGPNVTQKAMCEKYGVCKGTISSIVKQKDAILGAHTSGKFSCNTKRLKMGRFDDVDRNLMNWCQAAFAANMEGLTSIMLVEKAKDIAKALTEESGEPRYTEADIEHLTIDWISRFKSRHAISYKRQVGEAGDVTNEMKDEWLTTTLPALRRRYNDEDIFNLDELGLFWRLLPDKTLCLKNEKCVGGKRSKDRITVLAGTNATGTEKLPLLVIGKFAKPRCFKDVRNMPTRYLSNSKAWMTGDLFSQEIRRMDTKFRLQDRKVCFMIDNCPAHPLMLGLTNIELIRLPKNTTSVLQPMDGGIIRMLKAYYRRRLVQKRIFAFDNKVQFSVDLLEALRFLAASWSEIKVEHIRNCYRHCGFNDNMESAELQEDRLIEEETWNRAEFFFGLVPNALTFPQYVEVDDMLVTDANLATFSIEPSSISVLHQADSESEDDAVEPVAPPTAASSLEAVRTISRFLETTQGGEALLHMTAQLEDFVTAVGIKRRRQTTLTDYFQHH